MVSDRSDGIPVSAAFDRLDVKLQEACPSMSQEMRSAIIALMIKSRYYDCSYLIGFITEESCLFNFGTYREADLTAVRNSLLKALSKFREEE